MSHIRVTPHKCDVCGKGFSTLSDCNTHQHFVHHKKTFPCPIKKCRARKSSKKELNEHIKSSHPVLKFKYTDESAEQVNPSGPGSSGLNLSSNIFSTAILNFLRDEVLTDDTRTSSGFNPNDLQPSNLFKTTPAGGLIGSAVGSWVWNFEFDQLICLGTL
eukprot:sb/3472891/